MYSNSKIRKDHLFIVAVLSILIFSSITVINGFTNTVNGQTNATQANSTNNVTGLVNTQNIPLQKVHVGDIEIAYKMFGKGDPILLISPAQGDMNSWEPSLIDTLSANHTVIVFDNRGVGNTSTGIKPFSIQQFANDTAGLMDTLKVQNANVLGYSLGSMIAQQLAVAYPEKVNILVLIASACGGAESIPLDPRIFEIVEDMANKLINGTAVPTEQVKEALTIGQGSGWLKLHPDFLENVTIPDAKDLLPSITPENNLKQMDASQKWFEKGDGVCENLSKISVPTLILTGTDDVNVPTKNSLILAEKIPGSWLVQMKNAGHQIPVQYPDEINKIVQTFLSTVK